jgi:hypothetical protein
MKRLRRSKSSVCAVCGRGKGNRKMPRCPRCPGQPVASSLSLEPMLGVRIVSVDASMEAMGVAVTSPWEPGRLEVCETLDPFAPEVDDVCENALVTSARDGAPTWLVIEEPGVGGKFATPDMYQSIGSAIGIWRRAWALAGGSDSRVFRVLQILWQSGALKAGNTRDRDDRAQAAIDVARLVWHPRLVVLDALTGETMGEGEEPIAWDTDSAAAAMLAWFVLRWPTFVDQIGQRDRAAAEKLARRAAIAREDRDRPTLADDCIAHVQPAPARGTTGSLFG